MKIIEGTDSYLANNTASVFTSKLSNLMNLPDEDRNMLMGDNGFISQCVSDTENLIWSMNNLTDVYSGATDKVYPLDDIGDINMMLGKQAVYVMTHPALKQSYLDMEIEIPGYQPVNDLIGEDDPYYRAVYHGKLTKTMNGFMSKEWLTQRSLDLNFTEQMVTLANHRIITNELCDYLDYSIASGKVDVNDDGEVIKSF